MSPSFMLFFLSLPPFCYGPLSRPRPPFSILTEFCIDFISSNVILVDEGETSSAI